MAINQTQKDVLMNCKFVISTCEKQKSGDNFSTIGNFISGSKI